MGFLGLAVAATGVVLSPFGNVSDLVRSHNPWHGFHSKDAILFVVRIEEVPKGDCQRWVNAITQDRLGTPLKPQSSSAQFNQALKAWDPWDEDDLNSVTECDEFPCAVKLNQKEVSQMEATPEGKRRGQYFKLVQNRITHYEATQQRKGYEFPGDPMNPWTYFEKHGLKSSVSLPSHPTLWVRKLDFASGKIRPLRQVLDRRVSTHPSNPNQANQTGQEVTVWTRDAYTDHYFDSWGEWLTFSCGDSKAKTSIVTQALVLELDLLKKTDLVSKMMQGKMKSAVEENGSKYLDRTWARIKAKY